MSINNESKPVKIFISYSSRDREKVEKIHGFLKKAKLDVWRDKDRLETDWSREIAFALADADVLCLMWSKNAANSKYVQHEWVTARALEKPVYICRLGKYRDYPEPLHNRQDVSFEDIEEGSKELIRRLNDRNDFNERYEYNILPKNSYIPFNPNPHFTGRQRDLLELYLKMIGNLNKIGINQVGTVGMGGIGKTQLAVEFAYRFSFAFEEVFWIQAARPEEWRKEFVRLARNRLQLEIKNPEGADADEQFIYALQVYFKKESRKHTLVIMDNVSEPQLLNNDTFLFGITPLTLGCDLLFTTRRHFQLHGVSAQAVDILSPEDAYDLLTVVRQPQTPAEEDHALAICSAVGYLPLAVVLAGGYLNKYTDTSFADYREELIKNKLDVIDIGEVSHEELATRHAAAMGFTLQEDWNRLTDDHARLLFQLAGQFGEAEIIPKARLGLLAGIQAGKSKLHRPLDKAFNLLHDLSMVEKLESDARAIRLHPLVRAFAKGLIAEDETEDFKTSAAEKLKIAYFNYTRLKSELNARGVNAIIEDMQTGIIWWGSAKTSLKKRNVLKLLNNLIGLLTGKTYFSGLKELELLEGALSLSANQLNCDPQQLASHLIGRLKLAEESALQQLALQAENDSGDCCLRLVSPSLIPPGGPLLRTLEGHSRSVNAVAITPDGQAAVSASSDNTLKVWDLTSGTLRHSLEDHIGPVKAVAITPDGQAAVSASSDKTLKVWDLKSGTLRHSLVGHSWWVQAVAVTPDGQAAVSASEDNTLKVWVLSIGKEIGQFIGESPMHCCALAPDNKTIVAGEASGRVHILRLEGVE
ncbi:MAG: TIR domain-containing protein [Candidatus Aminicenantes bacterium]|nr:TIR domain-containing protein [Candidatus Aminicenantes bacterium]NIM81964.1 TIR domain-containing protein [Candidatus Aminicenantes bacterium]NIN21352.1 TIR domain-containing protein [Candidatus Aminicenantes bacterium]NIN45173.1 TIR domain-containing protein [Candidatus Aminicenantes bacterium]NIN87990.1 TIR domain-containing protein [Candidatus Aminicenantes bacterium]